MIFTIFPAIDLRRGQVVRLQEGDPARETRYSADPAETARRWLAAGARWLHVVNLDGAFGEADSANQAALGQILSAAGQAGARVQFGGGLRSLEAIEAALDLGVERAVLGTAVVERPQVLHDALRRFGPQRVAAGLDARQGMVQLRGWKESAPLRAAEVAVSLERQGLRWLIFTDVARDGLGTGLNLPATLALARLARLHIVASGGVRGEADVRRCQEAGLAGVIVGRALYEGQVSLPDLVREYDRE
jgi:phosphoribosylformimino-5-aminoimidazole carboxamide ribotide isomerase